MHRTSCRGAPFFCSLVSDMLMSPLLTMECTHSNEVPWYAVLLSGHACSVAPAWSTASIRCGCRYRGNAVLGHPAEGCALSDAAQQPVSERSFCH